MEQEVKKSHGLCFLWLVVVVFILDLASKFLILANFELFDSLQLLPVFSITYVRNYGAAFGLFLGQRWMLAIIAIIISIAVMRFLYKSPKKDYLNNTSFALILGGALGNLFDRLYHGFVVDFLDFHIGDWHYPVFNIADSAICIGVLLLIFGSIRSPKHKDKVA
ncbi:MAG: signal peptidase II [Candidatus Schmidhempelia sp.]|nr:signal peptidase II [Candidatus Schmidhempelia sp.]